MTDLATALGGSAALVAALTWMVRSVPAIAQRLAEARRARAETALVEAETAQAHATADHAAIDEIRQTCADLRRRLDACESRHDAADRREREALTLARQSAAHADEAREAVDRLKAEVAALRRVLKERGWTPPDTTASEPEGVQS